ncbi:MAG: histidine phosphatase family protein [Proteobacteria bacterium]|jgi:phosphohistidine phosphatase|nr:histidine phosphatase family protein [Pseudomonadota bacterium]
MKLVLFRHAIAMDREEAMLKKIEDGNRPLTPKGKEKSEQLVKELVRLCPDVDMIVCSPLLRSQQTSEIIAKAYKISKIDQSAELVPEAPPMAFIQWLSQFGRRKVAVVAVGHEPHLSTLASWILAGKTDSFVELKKSGFAVIEVDDLTQIVTGRATLELLVQPKAFVK